VAWAKEVCTNIPLKRYWDLLAAHVRPQKARFALLAVLLLASIGLQIFNPQIMRFFIDSAVTGQPLSALILAAAAFIVIALVQQVVGVSATYQGENVAWTATNALRAELAQHCLSLDMSFHNNRSPGELIERIDGDVAELSNFFSQLVIRVVGNILLLGGVLLALFLQDWRIGVAFAAFVAVALVVLNRVRGLAIPSQKALRQAISELTGYLEERLAGTEDIRSSGAVDFVINGLYKLQHTILGHQRKAWMLGTAVGMVGSSLLVVGNVIGVLSGYLLFQGGVITIGTVYLIIYYINLMARPIRELTQQAENLQNIGAATERLAELRAIQPKTVDGPGAVIPGGALSLIFDDVTFAYVEGEPVLRNISLELEPG